MGELKTAIRERLSQPLLGPTRGVASSDIPLSATTERTGHQEFVPFNCCLDNSGCYSKATRKLASEPLVAETTEHSYDLHAWDELRS